MMALFNHYVVLSSICVVDWQGTSQYKCVVYKTDDTSAAATYANAIEQPNAQSALISTGITKRLVQKYKSGETFGPSAIANANLRGSATANPAEQNYYQVGYYAVNSSANLSFNLRIWYDVIFFERKLMSTS